MKKILPIAALLVSPLSVQADRKSECDNAISRAAELLREQSMLSIATHNAENFSRDNIDTMIDTSQKIIRHSERILELCKMNREMTEGVLDVIITNTSNVEQLTYDQRGNK